MCSLALGRPFKIKTLDHVCTLGTRTTHVVVLKAQQRHLHESYIPSGRGGRSSFSGVVATVFGPNGFVGRSVTNHLAAMGSNIMVPYRGTYDRIRPMKLMGDLGQMMFRENFTMKKSDDEIRELIEHSNVVVNCIGTMKPYNFYTMEEVNVEWPKRLAQMVADKNDGTRLIHITHLRCNSEKGRSVSNILRQEHAAENAMREIYPGTIIVRSSDIHGIRDKFMNFYLSSSFSHLAFLGSVPVMYDGGKSTIVQPVGVPDVGEAIARIAKHPDSSGQTFELFGPDRFYLKDVVEYMYFLQKQDCHITNSLGPMTQSKASPLQKVVHKILDLYFYKMDFPRFWNLPRFLDLLGRDGSFSGMWMTPDFFRQMHITEETTNCPGFAELGITPTEFEQGIFANIAYKHAIDEFELRENNAIPKVPKSDEPKGKDVQLLVSA